MDTPTPRFSLVGIVVADMALSLAFYRLLGLDVPDDADTEGHVEVTLPGGIRLAWDTVEVVRSFEPRWAVPRGSHRVALAFHCGTPEGVDRTVAMLADAGHTVHRQPWDAVWGQRYAIVHDPDGTAVDLFAELPGSG